MADDATPLNCIGKVAFDDVRIASKAASRKPGRMVYKCDHCGCWHVGGRALASGKGVTNRFSFKRPGARRLW